MPIGPGLIRSLRVAVSYVDNPTAQFLGAAWGSGNPDTGGVLRGPRRISWGWAPATQSQFSRPIMLVKGELDNSVTPDAYRAMTDALPSRVVMDVACASHAIHWEREGHLIVREAMLEWFQNHSFQGVTNGRFRAVDGTITRIE